MAKVFFATGSRADYGIMRRFLKLLDEDNDIEVNILVTGALLDAAFGYQVDLIRKDGFNIAAEIEIPINTVSDAKVIHAMSVALDKFAEYFAATDVDLLIILGDRYEMLSVAISAAMQKIPILHIHGGETTYGNYDEFIRHAISKMSRYHYTATEVYQRRVIQLGEHPERVFCLGALGADNCQYIDEGNVPREVRDLPKQQYFVILFHPETLTNVNVLSQIKELICAVENMSNYKFVFLGTNADTHSETIKIAIKDFVEVHENAYYFENLCTNAYHYLLKNSICLIGNSSSGIIEAPSLGIFTINIGDRQKGRVRGNSVLDVTCNTDEIVNAMKKVLKIYGRSTPVNPYYKKNSLQLYYKTTKKILEQIEIDGKEPKIFYDLGK